MIRLEIKRLAKETRKRMKHRGRERIGAEYGDNKVGVERNLVFIFRVSLVVQVCLGRTCESLELVQWHASIPWWVTSLFLDQFLHILSTG